MSCQKIYFIPLQNQTKRYKTNLNHSRFKKLLNKMNSITSKVLQKNWISKNNHPKKKIKQKTISHKMQACQLINLIKNQRNWVNSRNFRSTLNLKRNLNKNRKFQRKKKKLRKLMIKIVFLILLIFLKNMYR